MRGREPISRQITTILLLLGLLVGAIFLSGYGIFTGSAVSSQNVSHPSNPPTTAQLAELLADRSLANPPEIETRQLQPAITAGESGAVLASDILLLNVSTFFVDLPLIAR